MPSVVKISEKRQRMGSLSESSTVARSAVKNEATFQRWKWCIYVLHIPNLRISSPYLPDLCAQLVCSTDSEGGFEVVVFVIECRHCFKSSFLGFMAKQCGIFIGTMHMI